MIRSSPDPWARRAIFAAIACERFAWYLLLAGLVLALTEHGLNQRDASSAYGWLLGAAYLAPLVGGYLGSRLSLRVAVIAGSSLLCSAYLLGTQGHLLGMLGLAAVGCGLFKPCLSTLLGLLYPANDARKQQAMSVYYLWIQLGALPSAFVGGLLRVKYGWGAAYLACAIGAGLAVTFLTFAWSRLKPYGTDLEALVGTNVDQPVQDQPWQWGMLITILVGGVLFWAANQQQGSTLTFWAQQRVDRSTIWGEIPAESFATLNPLFCALLTPVLGRWIGSLRIKLAIAMLLAAGSFAVLLAPTGLTVMGLAMSYLLAATCELLVSPLGMSSVTDLVPRKSAAFGMALWLLTTAVGGYLAGVFGGLKMETAAVLTIGLCLVGAAWYWFRWPRTEAAPEVVSITATGNVS